MGWRLNLVFQGSDELEDWTCNIQCILLCLGCHKLCGSEYITLCMCTYDWIGFTLLYTPVDFILDDPPPTLTVRIVAKTENCQKKNRNAYTIVADTFTKRRCILMVLSAYEKSFQQAPKSFLQVYWSYSKNVVAERPNMDMALCHTCVRLWPLTSLLVGEDKRVSAAAGELHHPGLLRMGKRQGHRGRFQHVVVAPHCRHKVCKLSDSGTFCLPLYCRFGILQRLSCVRWNPSWESLLRPIPHTLVTSLVAEAMRVKP